jgi:hypothetical protein
MKTIKFFPTGLLMFLIPLMAFSSCSKENLVPCAQDPNCAGYEDPYYEENYDPFNDPMTDAGNNPPPPENCHPAGIGCAGESFEAVVSGFPSMFGVPMPIRYKNADEAWVSGMVYFYGDEAYHAIRNHIQANPGCLAVDAPNPIVVTSSIHFLPFGSTFEFHFVTHRFE